MVLEIRVVQDSRMQSYLSAGRNENWMVTRSRVDDSFLVIGNLRVSIDGNMQIFSRISENTQIGFFTDEEYPSGFRQISPDDSNHFNYLYATNMGNDIIIICRN